MLVCFALFWYKNNDIRIRLGLGLGLVARKNLIVLRNIIQYSIGAENSNASLFFPLRIYSGPMELQFYQ